jgi:diadenosine tetraphosphate (Ap4A) HIT family hydrolase
MSNPVGAEGAPVFDPYARAWSVLDARGAQALEEIEAPLIVIQPSLTLAEAAIAAEVASGNPDAEILTPDDFRWIILPDAKPVAPVHLNVVAKRPRPYHQITGVERAVLDALTFGTERHIREALAPPHGVATFGFGEQVPTAHRHVVAREQYAHGLNWQADRPIVPVEIRREMRKRVALEHVPGSAEYFAQLVVGTIRRYHNLEITD